MLPVFGRVTAQTQVCVTLDPSTSRPPRSHVSGLATQHRKATLLGSSGGLFGHFSLSFSSSDIHNVQNPEAEPSDVSHHADSLPSGS